VVETVLNFEVYSQVPGEGSNAIEFSFDAPLDTSITAYKLFISLDQPGSSEFFNLWIIDNIGQEDERIVFLDTTDNKLHFVVETLDIHFGRELYCSLVSVNTLWEESLPTPDTIVFSAPSPPSNFVGQYDNQDVVLSWEGVLPQSTSTGINSTITAYKIYRTPFTAIPNSSVELNIDDKYIYNANYTYNDYVWSIDTAKWCMWFEKLEADGYVTFTRDSIMAEVEDITAEYSLNVYNLELYTENSENVTPTFIGYSSTLSFIDTTIERNTAYLYKVVAQDEAQNESTEIAYPVRTAAISTMTPYLRNPGNSPIDFLQLPYWRILKSHLIDENYYNKEAFALPYSKSGYIFTGYLGIRDANVDIYINDRHSQIVVTDEYGKFEFTILLKIKVSHKYSKI
jgi:hypothetical protein